MQIAVNKDSKGRRSQDIKSGISQQPLIGFSSTFKLKSRGPNQNSTTFNGRHCTNIKTESSGDEPKGLQREKFKKLKVEYLRTY